MAKTQIPTSVKIISIYIFLLSVYLLLSGLLSSIRWILLLKSADVSIRTYLIIQTLLFTVPLIALGFFGNFVSRFLLKGEKWARVSAIIILTISILVTGYYVIFRDFECVVYNYKNCIYHGSFYSLLFILNIIAVYYLAFNKKVKSTFS